MVTFSEDIGKLESCTTVREVWLVGIGGNHGRFLLTPEGDCLAVYIVKSEADRAAEICGGVPIRMSFEVEVRLVSRVTTGIARDQYGHLVTDSMLGFLPGVGADFRNGPSAGGGDADD